MSQPQLKSRGHTIEDWKTWEGRWELINGIAYDMTPAPSVEHQRVSRRLERAIEDGIEEGKRMGGGGSCEMFHAPLDVFLGGNVFQPDIVVVCDPEKISERGIEGAPDLIVEILSSSNSSRDTVVKRWAYAAAGVPEYLIVDPVEKFGTLLRLEGGHYVDNAPAEWDAMIALFGGKLPVALG